MGGGGAVTYSLQLAQCIRTYTTHTLPHKLIMCNTSFLKNLVTKYSKLMKQVKAMCVSSKINSVHVLTSETIIKP